MKKSMQGIPTWSGRNQYSNPTARARPEQFQSGKSQATLKFLTVERLDLRRVA